MWGDLCVTKTAAPTLPRGNRAQHFQRFFKMQLRVPIPQRPSLGHLSVCPPHTISEQESEQSPPPPFPTTALRTSRYHSYAHYIDTEAQRGEAEDSLLTSFHLLFPLPRMLFLWLLSSSYLSACIVHTQRALP